MNAAAAIVLAPLALASAPPVAPRDAEISALLLRKTQAFSEAAQRGDGSAMAAMLDERVVFFNEGGDDANRADMAAAKPVASPGITTRMTVEDWHCEVHGDVAVASFIDDQRQDWHGQPFHARYRSVETWLQQGDDWRMIASETIALRDDPQAIQLSPALLDDYVGDYEAAPGTRFRFTRSGGELYASTAGGAPTLQRAEARDLFFTPGRSRFTKVFERDARGSVTGFRLRRDIVFHRVNPRDGGGQQS